MNQETYLLNEYGEFITTRKENEIYVDLTYEEKPQFWYQLSEGKIKSISFQVSIENKNLPLLNYTNEMVLMYLSLLSAQEKMNVFNYSLDDLFYEVYPNTFTRFSLEEYGVRADYEAKYQGYNEMGSVLIPKDNTSTQYFNSSFSVTMP
jgi:hypothetical protein